MSLESRASAFVSSLSPLQQACVNCNAFFSDDDTDEQLISKVFVQCCYKPSYMKQYFTGVDTAVTLLVRSQKLTADDSDVQDYAVAHFSK